MKKEDLLQVRGALQHINPFMFRAETGRLLTYKDANASYVQCLMALLREFPAGFIEIPYFMMKYQGVTPLQVGLLVGAREYAYIKLWDKMDSRREALLKQVLDILLQVSGCSFDYAAFSYAVTQLDHYLKTWDMLPMYQNLNNLFILKLKQYGY